MVVPPHQPIQVDENSLRSIESFLGLLLPKDYVDLAKCYGTGCFGDNTYYFWIDNLLRPSSVEMLSRKIAFWRKRQGMFPNEFDYDLFPARPGYLPCGADVDGGMIGWLTEGLPDSWSVVTKHTDAEKFEVHSMPLTTYLAKALTHEIRPDMWRPDFPEDVSRVSFVTGEHYHQSVAQRN